MRRGSNIKTMTRIISIIDSKRRILTVSLSVPKTIGIGPIITRPPPFVLPRTRYSLKNIERVVRKMIMKPVKMSANPKVTSVAELNTLPNPRILIGSTQISFNILAFFVQNGLSVGRCRLKRQFNVYFRIALI